jgi:hypothetical protein
MHFETKIGGIYKITHLPTEQYYIGMSVSIFTRWQSHFTSLSNHTHSSTKFRELWNSTNPNEWQFQILEILPLGQFKTDTSLKGKALEKAYRQCLLRTERKWMSSHSKTYALNKDDKYFT